MDVLALLRPISRRIRLLAGRSVIRLVNDSLKEQGVQLTLLSGEVGNAERYQHYGFTSRPFASAEAIVLAIAGSRDHLVTVADGDRRYRKTGLAEGEAALYDDQGQCVWLCRNGIIRIYGGRVIQLEAASGVTVTAPEVTVTASGNVSVDTPQAAFSGRVTAAGALASNTSVADPAGTMQAMRDRFNSHTHAETGTTTGPPDQRM